MLSDRIAALDSPPRRVPLPVVSRTMLGLTGWLGGIFLAFGLIFVWIFAGDFRPANELLLAVASTTGEGTISRVTPTGATENNVQVYACDYWFTPSPGTTVTGTSYTTGRRWTEGDRVTVKYVSWDPTITRIEGARSSRFSWGVLFVYIFPLIGAILFATSVYRGWQHVNLLRHGEISGATIISSGPTGTRVNGRPVIEYAYEFTASDGDGYTGTCKSLATPRVGDEEQEPVLYLPSNPYRSVLVDALPLRHPLGIDESGQWSSRVGVGALVGPGLLLLGVVASVGYVIVRTIGGF